MKRAEIPRKRRVGERAWFEYHCYEGHDSSDAQAWYRSHQQVTILAHEEVDEPYFLDDGSEATRYHYRVRFADGHEHSAFDDELHNSPEGFGTQAWTPGGFGPPHYTDIERHDPAYAAWAKANGHNG